MRMIQTLGILLAMLAALGFQPATQALAADLPTAAEPATGAPGTLFRFTHQFRGEAIVGFWLTAPDGTVIGSDDYGFEVGKNGRGRWEWQAPADAAAGLWRMTAQPIAGGYTGLESQVIIPFTITGTPQTAPPDLPKAEPATAPPGAVITFTAAGFTPGEIGDYWVTTPDGRTLGDPGWVIYVDEFGGARWEWQVPGDAVPGVWLMVARDRSSQTPQSIRFTVAAGATQPAPPPGAAGGATPPQGTPGTSFSITITGFDNGEKVSYWASSPDGKAYGSDDFTTFADDNGRITLTWQSASDAVRGEWMLVGFGDGSRKTLTVRFTIM